MRKGPGSRVIAFVLAAVAVVAAPAAVAADVGDDLIEPGLYVSPGSTTAISFGSGDVGVAVGGEVSVAGFNVFEKGSLVWLGGYGDLLWDSRTGDGRFSVGPEIGWLLFGLDGGYVGAFDGSGYRHGLTLRALLTYIFVALYGRVGHLFGEDGETWGEVGLLIKIPVCAEGACIW